MSAQAIAAWLTSRQERLLWRTKAAYAIGDLGNSVGPGAVIPFWYLYFLTDIAKLDPALAGLSLLVGKIWDALNDPLVGILSDGTRTRWGWRRPYLLFGALPYGVTFALLWVVPPIRNQLLLCLYFALMYMLFDTAFALVSCAYVALTPELTLDHDERTSLVTYRMAVSIGGGLLVALLFGLVILPLFPEGDPMAFLTVGLVCGAVFIPPIFVTFFCTREREEFQVAQAPNPLEGLRFVLRNRPWRYTLGMNLLSWMPVDTAAALFPYSHLLDGDERRRFQHRVVHHPVECPYVSASGPLAGQAPGEKDGLHHHYRLLGGSPA